MEGKETPPPPRISQGKLIEMMEERGLGTKATRADIIQKLYDRGYVFGNPPGPSETGSRCARPSSTDGGAISAARRLAPPTSRE